MKRYVSISILLALLVLSFHFSARAQSGTPPAPPAGSWKGKITGKVVNKTPGAGVPGSVDLVLHGWDQSGNQGDRTVKDVLELPRDRKGTLKFPLPENAKNVAFDTQEPDRFVLLPDGFADTAPLPPGSRSSQVVVRFNLSYQDQLDFLFQLPVPVDAVSLLIPEESGLSRGQYQAAAWGSSPFFDD